MLLVLLKGCHYYLMIWVFICLAHFKSTLKQHILPNLFWCESFCHIDNKSKSQPNTILTYYMLDDCCCLLAAFEASYHIISFSKFIFNYLFSVKYKKVNMNVNCWVWGNIMLVRQPICHNQANVSSFKRKTPWGRNTVVVLDMFSMGHSTRSNIFRPLWDKLVPNLWSSFCSQLITNKNREILSYLLLGMLKPVNAQFQWM
jgi:hypothetical protein